MKKGRGTGRRESRSVGRGGWAGEGMVRGGERTGGEEVREKRWLGREW